MVPVKLRVLGQVSEIHGAFLRDDGVDDRFVLLHAHVVRFEVELELAVHAEGVVFLEDGEVVVGVVENAHLVPALGDKVEGRDNHARFFLLSRDGCAVAELEVTLGEVGDVVRRVRVPREANGAEGVRLAGHRHV